jgi:hypothetical protein
MEDGVLETLVAFAGQTDDPEAELRGLCLLPVGKEVADQEIPQFDVPGDDSRIREGEGRLRIRALGPEVLQGLDLVSQVQPEIPQIVEQTFDGALGLFPVLPPIQQQEIHIRVGEHLRASVSAQGQNAKPTASKVLPSDLGDQVVHGPGQVRQSRLGTKL